ncbi:unnamed protein product [Lymnaea stagnalis]|uniref:Uncharacterized protein n=1 Tax=Lymnaea stagnalis TaxID=6523 RepID=A0AAV2IH37_LYMST
MEMETTKTLLKTQKALSSLESPRFNVFDTNLTHLETLEETLYCLGQNVAVCRNEFLTTLSKQLLLSEFQKDSHQWLTVTQAEKDLVEALNILSEKKSFLKRKDNQLEETTQIASEALSTMKEKMAIISNKKGQLENKYNDLTKLYPKVANIQHLIQLKEAIDKVYKLLESATKAQNILRNRLHRLEEILQIFQYLSTEQQIIENETKNRLKNLQGTIGELEECTGFSCYIKGDNSVQVEFLASPPVVEKEEELANSTDSKLTVTMDFSVNNQGHLWLTDIQLDQNIEWAESLKRMAQESKDLSSFIIKVNKVWLPKVTLNSEISSLRKRHAIDWIPEKNLLLLMVKHSNNVVCSIKVPPSYPNSDKIILESITGHPSGWTSSNISPPTKTTLSGWLSHLERLLGQQ